MCGLPVARDREPSETYGGVADDAPAATESVGSVLQRVLGLRGCNVAATFASMAAAATLAADGDCAGESGAGGGRRPRHASLPLVHHDGSDAHVGVDPVGILGHGRPHKGGVFLGETELIARAGDVVPKPRGIRHAFWNADDRPARVLEIITPARIRAVLDHAAVIAAQHPDPEDETAFAKWQQLFDAYGVEWEPETIARLTERHRLTG